MAKKKTKAKKKAGARKRTLAKKKTGATKKSKPQTEWLFVQSAGNGELVPHPRRKNVYTLTLRGLQPTIRFSDRPVRKTGHESTKQFVDNWAKGSDSFKDDPPNAELVIYTPGKAPSAVTVELKDPQWAPEAPHRLSYTVTLVGEEAKSIAGDGPASLFIDSSGKKKPLGYTINGAYRCPQTGSWLSRDAAKKAGADFSVSKGRKFPGSGVWELVGYL